MLKDIIEAKKNDVRKMFPSLQVYELDGIVEQTAQIVAREVLRKAKEKIGEVPTGWLENEDEFVRGMAYRWRDILTHLQSLEEELSAEVLSK
jgi:hypothetical protein